jgi:glycerol-3-phosphate acyltransferase PlsY
MEMPLGNLLTLFSAALGGYFLGTVPFGMILTRLKGMSDIRHMGSGNIGATNVLRTGGKALAALTLLLDGGKGALAVLVFTLWGRDAALAAAAGSLMGHIFPLWLNFKGGKGVATALGTLLALNWLLGLLACATWLTVGFLFRYSSLASLAAMMVAPLYSLWRDETPMAIYAVLAVILVWFRHADNIRRLFSGEETKIGAD